MAVTKPSKVPKKRVSSLNITGFSGGWSLHGSQNIENNQFENSRGLELTSKGLLTNRRSLQPWLPDTEGKVYDISHCFINHIDGYINNGKLHHFTLDNGRVRYIVDGESSWSDCGGDNTFTSDNGGKCILLRASDALLVLNGGNGDKLAYVDLSDSTFPIVKYNLVSDPSQAPTGVATGINGSVAKIYYAYSFSSSTGETKISPIEEVGITKPRSAWTDDGTEYVTITRPSGHPAHATYWNLYIALSASGGTVQETDMLRLAGGLDLNTDVFEDNGSLAIDVGAGTAPTVNNTDGPRVTNGIETNGRPILFGDVDNPYSIWIGGDGEHALDFSSANGGYRAEPSKGTNYYPATVFGFRNGQGIPALTILFSNTEGLSKQATLEQQTINYGNQSFVVWGVTEQNYGAAGVASPLGVINYKGQASFLSTDGFIAMDTEPSLQNVIATKRIDDDITDHTRRIKSSALPEVVGAAWDNKLYWTVPSQGFDLPNEILVRDMDNNGSWYRLDIAAQWIGVVTPPDSPAFVFICQDNKIMKLFDSFGTVDYPNNTPVYFSTEAESGLIGYSDAYNSHQALVQVMFYLLGLTGTVTLGVTYRDQAGDLQYQQVVYEGPAYTQTATGGWSDPQNLFTGPAPSGWSASIMLDETAINVISEDVRVPVPINDIASEVKWHISSSRGHNAYTLKSVSFEGVSLGVEPDLV